MAGLLSWREDMKRARNLSLSLVREMCSNQRVFNGFGKHTTIDLLYALAVWPGTPPCVICENDDTFEHFASGLVYYSRMWLSRDYWNDCLAPQNLSSAVAHDRWSNKKYLSKYLWVFRKSEISQMPSALYNQYVRLGLLNPEHTIGTSSFPP